MFGIVRNQHYLFLEIKQSGKNTRPKSTAVLSPFLKIHPGIYVNIVDSKPMNVRNIVPFKNGGTSWTYFERSNKDNKPIVIINVTIMSFPVSTDTTKSI